MMARHGGGPVGSAARDTTASPYVGLHRAHVSQAIEDALNDPAIIAEAEWLMSHPPGMASPFTTYDDPPDDPPRCLSCGHLEAGECGCTCCTWTCDERPANV